MVKFYGNFIDFEIWTFGGKEGVKDAEKVLMKVENVSKDYVMGELLLMHYVVQVLRYMKVIHCYTWTQRSGKVRY